MWRTLTSNQSVKRRQSPSASWLTILAVTGAACFACFHDFLLTWFSLKLTGTKTRCSQMDLQEALLELLDLGCCRACERPPLSCLQSTFSLRFHLLSQHVLLWLANSAIKNIDAGCITAGGSTGERKRCHLASKIANNFTTEDGYWCVIDRGLITGSNAEVTSLLGMPL
jgi:hypothetical protein